jgi:hypothetical protein
LALTLLAPAVLTMRRSADKIVSVAVTVEVLVPSDVLSEPAGMVFVASGAPEVVPVITTETEHAPPGAITDPELTVKEFVPATAVTVEFKQVVAGRGGDAFNIPVGYWSTKAEVKVAEVRACVLVNVMTKSVVPPALMVSVGV